MACFLDFSGNLDSDAGGRERRFQECLLVGVGEGCSGDDDFIAIAKTRIAAEIAVLENLSEVYLDFRSCGD